jgi:UDP-2-acetamido-2,6-beta-L-arabino-hexul-4-ose reductase
MPAEGGAAGTVLVTGARGFVGRHLVLRLRERDALTIREFGRQNSDAELAAWAAEADVVFHLAAENRPPDDAAYEAGNVGFTTRLCAALAAAGRAPHVIATSSLQATGDSAYGRSKRRMEEVLADFGRRSGARVTTFRVRNIFGKWSRPNYNSVVATFCHNIARDLPITISDPSHQLRLVHIDDVVDALVAAMDTPPGTDADGIAPDTMPAHAITLGELAELIRTFREMQQTLRLPDLASRFNVRLYSVYLSHLEPRQWEYGLERRTDERGDLAEFIKGDAFGQVFVSRTHPGVTRGNHWHHTKTEKFLVLAGEALIRFRHVEGDDILEFPVRGADYRVVEIPPGWTHSITNTGDSEMITLFWASEVFDPARPDTLWLPVEP